MKYLNNEKDIEKTIIKIHFESALYGADGVSRR
jgi:hypothetical protein